MIKGKVSRPARQFVESYFGRGTAAGKLTTNPKTAVLKMFKGASPEERRFFRTDLKDFSIKARGAHIQDAPLAKRDLIYLRKATKSEMMKRSPYYHKSATDTISLKAQDALVLSHELFHRAFHNRYYRIHKADPPKILAELISSAGALSYLRKFSETDYKNYLAKFDEGQLIKQISFPCLQATSPFGNKLAILLHKKLSAGAVDRLLAELAESNIKTCEDAAEWVEKKLAQ